jgi:hypothetical protein
MNRNATLATSLLWATAIIESAIVGAPHAMTFVVLPALASAYLVVAARSSPKRQCRDPRDASA